VVIYLKYKMANKWFKKEAKEFKKGVPKKDGSGGGIRLNKGRGGCKITEEFGKGKEEFDW